MITLAKATAGLIHPLDCTSGDAAPQYVLIQLPVLLIIFDKLTALGA
jgi:hypothetical protein